MRRRSFMLVATLSISILGCKSAQQAELDQGALSPDGLGLSGQDLAGDQPQAEEQEADLDEQPDGMFDEHADYEDGFCRDDIYAKYLFEKYDQINPLRDRLKRYKGKYSRRRARRAHERETMHFARQQMNGPTLPYFGALPVVTNEKVDFWIRYFKGTGRRTFMKWLVRGEALKPTIKPILTEHGIPVEFFYLAMVESGLNHGAYSRARATGTWQFMYGTAKLYGLKINHWVDERRDPIKSTIAAATFLKDLYARFGDWYLAMAAYNAGPGRVRSAIRRAKTRDFWAIANTRYLPRETKNYVPKVLAAVLLAANAKAHGFDVKPNPTDMIPATHVEVDRPVRLTEVAQRLGFSHRQLKRWNPEIIRDITPPGRNAYKLRLPQDHLSRFAEVRSELSFLEVSDVHYHRIRSGDTLYGLARKYKVRVRQIKDINPGLRASALRIGKNIAIPVPSVVAKPDAA